MTVHSRYTHRGFLVWLAYGAGLIVTFSIFSCYHLPRHLREQDWSAAATDIGFALLLAVGIGVGFMLKMLLNLRHRVIADDAGIRQTGPVGWSYRWDQLQALTVVPLGAGTRLEVVPRPGEPEPPLLRLRNPLHSSVKDSIGATIQDDRAVDFARLAAAHGVVVEGYGTLAEPVAEVTS